MKTYPPGTRIGQYEIAGHPLMGGMGIVYICLDTETDRPVALKTFQPKFLPDRAARDRFLREGTAWVDLGTHPHVVRCYRVFQPENAIEVYLVLELVAKEQGREDASLRAWLAPGQPLPVEQAMLFTLQIARGMKHATDVIPGFVHRDLKPENVLVGADRLSEATVNRLRVTDFGLAAVLQETAPHLDGSAASDTPSNQRLPAIRNTQLTHGAVGTPLYMAPEQWQGQPMTAAADVYALGCILYEMLAGQHAVSGRSLAAIQRAHCEGGLHPLPPGLPKPVHVLLTRCLALEPGKRYESWGTVEAALVAAHEAVTGHPAPAAEPVAAHSRAERVAAGWSYNTLGISYLNIGKPKVAVGYFERAQEVGRAEGEQQLEMAGLTNLGSAHGSLGDNRQAIEHFEQALEIAYEINDRQGEGNALGNLGLAYADVGDFRRAITLSEQWLEIAREIGDRKGEEQALGNLGIIYTDLGDVRRAITYYNQVLTIASEIGDRQGEGKALGNLGMAYTRLGDSRQAITLFKRQFEAAQEIGDRRGEGAALSGLGQAYLNLGDAQQSIRCSEQALAILREVSDSRSAGQTLNNLGNAHLTLEDPHQAIECYKQALEIAREIDDRSNEGNSLGSLGNACLALGNPLQAIVYYQQCLAICREIGNRHGEGNALGNLATALAKLGRLTDAIQGWNEAMEIHQETGDANGEARLSMSAATQLMTQGYFDEALPYAEQAAQLFTRIGHTQYAQAAQRMATMIRMMVR